MDRGTKIYAGVLLVIAVLLGFWTLYEDPKVKALNALLARDEPVQSYPFRFRVLYLEGNTAVMATPRSSARSSCSS